MKRQLIVLVCAVSALGFAGGCGNHNLKQWEKPWDPNSIWDGNAPEGGAIPDFFQGKSGLFPESMVGVWEAEIPDILWDIKFESNGSMLRIVHPEAGALKVEQGGAEANGPDNSYYVFKLGPCEAKYFPDARMLRAKIVIDYFIMKMPSGELEGRMEDYFEGFVSEDGSRWDTQWFSFRWLKGATPPNIKGIKAHPMPLVFIKLDPTQPRAEQVME
ncbi:MAG: hypothetical protein WBL85_03960 [Sedimentisphaerales bacterium]